MKEDKNLFNVDNTTPLYRIIGNKRYLVSRGLYSPKTLENIDYDHETQVLCSEAFEKELDLTTPLVNSTEIELTNPVSKETGWRSSDLSLLLSLKSEPLEQKAILERLQQLPVGFSFEGLTDEQIQAIIPDRRVDAFNARAYGRALATMYNNYLADAQNKQIDVTPRDTPTGDISESSDN